MNTTDEHKQIVRDIIEKIKEKLGDSRSIEDLVRIHESESLLPIGLEIKGGIFDAIFGEEKGNVSGDILEKDETDVPECAKIVYYPWNEVLASMHIMPDKVEITEEVCSDCGAKLVSLYFFSNRITWKGLCGRAGHMIVCPNCPRQIGFRLELMN